MSVIVGVDFGGPARARDQRRKIIAMSGYATDWRRYRIDSSGINRRLLTTDPPGWTAQDLLDELLTRPVRVVGFDFPFGIPWSLLRDEAFASAVGVRGAFDSWRAFNAFVAEALPLTEQLDFSPFAAWRNPADRARLWTKRATDVATGGQPPLKDKFQATFQMTLLGNAVLAKLWESRAYRVLPFAGGRGAGEIIEVYPGATLRSMGLVQYKSRPDEAVRLGIAACAAAGITLDVDIALQALCCRYSSGTARAPDHDVADAFVALCTAILHAEGACRPALASDDLWSDQELKLWEGAIQVMKLTSSDATARQHFRRRPTR